MKLISLFLFLPSVFAHTGTETHGGDILICAGQPNQVLDYYYASLPGPIRTNTIVDVNAMSAQEVVNLALSRLSTSYFGRQVARVHGEIGNLDLWMMTEGLSDVNDDGSMVKYPNGCSLGQGAVRSGAAVYLDRFLINGIPEGQLGVLVLHEVLYVLAVEKGQRTSAQVRPLIRALLQKNFDINAVIAAVASIGWNSSPLPMYDAAKPHFYSYDGGRPIMPVKIEGVSAKEGYFAVSVWAPEFGILDTLTFNCDKSGKCVLRSHKKIPLAGDKIVGEFPEKAWIQLETEESFVLHLPERNMSLRFVRYGDGTRPPVGT